MKELNDSEQCRILGGQQDRDYTCQELLQHEAASHIMSPIEELENAYWDDWNRRYEECLKSMGIDIG